MTNVARFLVGDLYGRVLAELEPDIGPISWRLSDVGQVQFSLATTDGKLTETNLRFGNRVLIQFDNGLPPWGGVIDTPRNWTEGSVTCTAYSAEYLFSTRTTGKSQEFSGVTAGDIFTQLIGAANAFYSLGITLGEVESGGSGITVDYHFTDLLSVFRTYLTDKISDADFDVAGSLSGGQIVFTANLYERRGADKLNYALVDGQNCRATKYSEQGRIVNAWDIVGSGSDWSDDRLVGHAEDQDGFTTYGYRQASAIHSNVSGQEALDAIAATALAESQAPHNMVSVQAVDLAPATFADYDLGDRIRLLAPAVGFTGLDLTVRVVGRSFDPNTGICDVVVRGE